MPISLLIPIEGISAAMYTETFNLHVLLSQMLHFKWGIFLELSLQETKTLLSLLKHSISIKYIITCQRHQQLERMCIIDVYFRKSS